LTLGAEYDLFKRLILIQKDYPRQEEFYEKDISAEQYSEEEDAWVSGTDEYPGRKECSEEKANEGKKEADRLDGRIPEHG